MPFAFLARAQNPIVINSDNTWQTTANLQSGNSWATPAGLSNSAGWVNALVTTPLECNGGNYGTAAQQLFAAGAQPIWNQSQTTPGSHYFRKSFALNQPVNSCNISVLCDNTCMLLVNGIFLGIYAPPAGSWPVMNVAVPLNILNSCGTNVIGVLGTNSSACGMLLLRATIVTQPLTISGQTAVCIGGSANLGASGGASYKWNTGATSASITVTPTSTSTYTVTVTNAQGCSQTASKTVTVNPLPTASITGLTTICQGFPAVLTASGAGTGGKYKWSTGASTAAITVMPSTTTSYTVTVTSAAGCSSTKSTTVTVAAAPVVKINLSSLNCNGTSATISLVSSVSGGNAPYTYKWSNGATSANLTNVPVGAYSLTVTTTPIATGDGCTKVVSKTFCNPCASNTSPNEFGNGTEPGDIAEIMTAINPQEADISLEQDEFVIVPNPATDDLTIRTTKGTGHSEIIIFDILGAIRQRDVLYQNEETIDISNLQDGMYLISILTDGKLAFTKKIVKQRAQ